MVGGSKYQIAVSVLFITYCVSRNLSIPSMIDPDGLGSYSRHRPISSSSGSNLHDTSRS